MRALAPFLRGRCTATTAPAAPTHPPEHGGASAVVMHKRSCEVQVQVGRRTAARRQRQRLVEHGRTARSAHSCSVCRNPGSDRRLVATHLGVGRIQPRERLRETGLRCGGAGRPSASCILCTVGPCAWGVGDTAHDVSCWLQADVDPLPPRVRRLSPFLAPGVGPGLGAAALGPTRRGAQGASRNPCAVKNARICARPCTICTRFMPCPAPGTTTSWFGTFAASSAACRRRECSMGTSSSLSP